jgi:hypothetical protein
MRRLSMAPSWMPGVAVCWTAVPNVAMRLPAVTCIAVRGPVATGGMPDGRSVSARMEPMIRTTAEAVLPPTMLIAPSRPRARAEKYPVIEVVLPPVASRGAAVRRIVVIAIGAIRRWGADLNGNLGICRMNQAGRYQKRRRKKQNIRSTHASLPFLCLNRFRCNANIHMTKAAWVYLR